MKLDLKYVRLIIEYGLTSFIIQVAGSVVNIVLNKLLVKHGGDTSVSGMGIVNSVSTLVILPVLGLVQGAQPIISYNYGAGNKKRIKETIKLNMIISTVIMIGCFILTNIFANQIVKMFNNEEELIVFTSRALIIWFLVLPIIGLQITCANYFQCVGKVKIAVFLQMSRQILILVPLIILFAGIWKLDGILYAGPVSDLLAFAVTITFFMVEYRKNYKDVSRLKNKCNKNVTKYMIN